jgi:hypothetical protein
MKAAADSITNLCSELLTSCAARAVCVVGSDDGVIAVTPESMRSIADGLWSKLDGPAETQPLDLGEGLCAHVSVAGAGRLAVIFDSKSSLGLVRLRVRSMLEVLERLLASDSGGHTPQGSGSGGGSPPTAHAAVSVTDLDKN